MRLIRHEAATPTPTPISSTRRSSGSRPSAWLHGAVGLLPPASVQRSFVVHLDDWYAQSTRTRTSPRPSPSGWTRPGLAQALPGMEGAAEAGYVDQLMRSLAGKPPVHQPAYGCRPRLPQHQAEDALRRRRKLFEDVYPDFYDNDLRSCSPPARSRRPPGGGRVPPPAPPSAHERVCQWTKEKKYRVNKLLAA